MAAGTGSNDRVTTANGIVEGTTVPGSQIRVFKGIPYAQPPVGDLRWKAPQPPLNWNGVLQAHDFGPRAMQLPLFGDMVFRSRGMSEDCLYLNVWTPARSAHEHLPVLVYFYGGGFAAGDGSELRYDGESMARRGIVALTVNYRLGIFGFLAHPELTRESPNYASGNYGLMDQSAALQWVQKNIAAFGGDPNRVTIAGQSAGSFSVCAQMASPLSRNLIAGAIGESGSLIGMWPPTTLVDAEINGVTFANKIGAPTIAALRAIPATQLLDDVGKTKGVLFGAIVDGYFMPKDPEQIFAAGQQAHVPLLIGWNSEESGPDGVLKGKPATPENYIAAVQKMQPDRAADLPGDDARRSLAIRHRLGKRSGAWVQHLEMVRHADQDRWKVGVPVLLHTSSAVHSVVARKPRIGRGTLRRDRVRDGQSGHQQGLRVDTRRLQAIGDVARLFRELHQDRRSERSNASCVAKIK
jgi:para-nitrobenzyl esterase